jgi:D-arabinose 1-dehydrogenase-like Zn-dependent alcohol dehydrogenase
MMRLGRSVRSPLGWLEYVRVRGTGDDRIEPVGPGGASSLSSTVTHGPAVAAPMVGLAAHRRLLVLGATESTIETPNLSLIMGRRAVGGWYSGILVDAEATLSFSAQTGVHSIKEASPLERAAEAYDRMMSGKARFRVVRTIDR